jgi:hypothetical protein
MRHEAELRSEDAGSAEGSACLKDKKTDYGAYIYEMSILQ